MQASNTLDAGIGTVGLKLDVIFSFGQMNWNISITRNVNVGRFVKGFRLIPTKDLQPTFISMFVSIDQTSMLMDVIYMKTIKFR